MAALRKRRAVADSEQSADSQAQLEFENTVNEGDVPQETMGENQLEKKSDDSENLVTQESNTETENTENVPVVKVKRRVVKVEKKQMIQKQLKQMIRQHFQKNQ